jgi:hypothetical protein
VLSLQTKQTNERHKKVHATTGVTASILPVQLFDVFIVSTKKAQQIVLERFSPNCVNGCQS